MRVYRISKPAYVSTALLGQGAALFPGRWNSAGVRLAYTAESVALAMLEMLVHVNLDDVPAGRRLLAFHLPDASVDELPQAQWPAGWDKFPYLETVRSVGDSFIRSGASLGLRVPSAVARGEFNVLVNPAHPRFNEIALLEDHTLGVDPRLFPE